MNKEYFTLDQANAQVGRLQQAFAGVMQLRTQLKMLYERLQSAGYPPESPDPQAPADAPAAIRCATAHFAGLTDALHDHIDRIRAAGCTIRDVELGRVDWLARIANQDILLCWRFGETEVGHWRQVGRGFSSRRPISELYSSEMRGP
jgi:hypothetical protein